MLVTAEQSVIADFAQKNKIFVALGFFDGVHRGHQALLKRCVKMAEDNNGVPCVLLIEPHPVHVLKGPEYFSYLNTLDQRISLLQKYGPFNIFIVPFTKAFADLEPLDFVRQYLIGLLNVQGVVTGFNYSFGKKGAGRVEDLKAFGYKYGFQVEQVRPVIYENNIVSSTLIRQLIERGHMEKAAEYLGHPHVYAGSVVGGNRLGSILGFPTANIQLDQNILWPGYGVYGGFIRDEAGNMYKAVVNIGVRPTIRQFDHQPSFEAHLLNYSGNLYDKKLQVILTDRLRQEKNFESLEALKKQVFKDRELAVVELDRLRQKYFINNNLEFVC